MFLVCYVLATSAAPATVHPPPPPINPLFEENDYATASPHASRVEEIPEAAIPWVQGSVVAIPRGLWVPRFVSARTLGAAPQKVPRVIYQSYDTCHVSQSLARAVSSIIDSNPSYEYRFFDVVACAHMIRSHFDARVADAYDMLVPGSYKCDLWRICVLYLYGGVYADMRYHPLVPLDEMIGADTNLLLVDEQMQRLYVHGCFLAATPRQPIFARAIRALVRNVELRRYGRDPLDVTGPGLLGTAAIAELGIQKLPRELQMPRGGLLRSLLHSGKAHAHKDWAGRTVAHTKMLGTRDNVAFYASIGKENYSTMWYKRAIYKGDAPGPDMGELGALLLSE